MNARTHTSRPPLQAFLLGLLLCACLVAQTLGLVHRVAHGLPGERLARQVATALPATAHDAGPSLLFAGHAHAADCLLYDQLGVADLLASVPVASLPAVLAPLVAAVLHAGVPARAARVFEARAPPFLR